jgi:hypothetical protein
MLVAGTRTDMSRRATDRVKEFHLMSATITPAPVGDDVTVVAPNPAFTAVPIDPDSAPPYTYLWEQQPVADLGVTIGTPNASSTTMGPLIAGNVYYLRLTITNAQLTKFVKSMRVFAT